MKVFSGNLPGCVFQLHPAILKKISFKFQGHFNPYNSYAKMPDPTHLSQFTAAIETRPSNHRIFFTIISCSFYHPIYVNRPDIVEILLLGR